MDDRIRASDADRDRVTARLRDHFAEGRLTPGELDERISAVLNAKTFGDLRRVMADLPEPALIPRAPECPQRLAQPWIASRHGPRVLPLLLLVLLVVLLIPQGGWLLFAFFQLILMFWLVAGLAGVLLASRFRRRMHRDWQSGYTQHWPGQAHWR